MPQGDKSKYTDKQKRQAEHIEKSYEKRGVGAGKSKERAWRTVNKRTGGAGKKRSGSRTRRSSGAKRSTASARR